MRCSTLDVCPTAPRYDASFHETFEGRLLHVAVLRQVPLDSLEVAIRAVVVQEVGGLVARQDVFAD